MWNYLTTLVIEGYIGYCMLSMSFLYEYGIDSFKTGSPVMMFLNLEALFFICFFSMIPYIMYKIFKRKHSKFQQDYFSKKYGDLFGEFTHHGKKQVHFITFFCYKRLTLMFIVIYLQNYPYVQ